MANVVRRCFQTPVRVVSKEATVVVSGCNVSNKMSALGTKQAHISIVSSLRIDRILDGVNVSTRSPFEDPVDTLQAMCIVYKINLSSIKYAPSTQATGTL